MVQKSEPFSGTDTSEVNLLIDSNTDGHVHTRLCHHARGEMEEYVQAGLARGLKKIIFLEHLEIGIRYFETTWLSQEDFTYYISEGERLRQQYQGKIDVGIGIEVGYNPHRVSDIQAFLNTYHWDLIGISYHFLETGDDLHLNMVSSKSVNLEAAIKYGPERIITAYYQGLLEAVEKLPGTVLCHLDAVLRHLPDVIFTNDHHQLVMKILDAVAAKNMALEINMSGYVKRDEPYPAFHFLREAARRGIRLSLGSDSHCPEQVGRYFDKIPQLTAELQPFRP